jgi:hypothetical protein
VRRAHMVPDAPAALEAALGDVQHVVAPVDAARRQSVSRGRPCVSDLPLLHAEAPLQTRWGVGKQHSSLTSTFACVYNASTPPPTAA